MKYDLPLFLELNAEYLAKPIQRKPARSNKPADAMDLARRRLAVVGGEKLNGLRLLEIGCGRGELCKSAGRMFRCEVVGVDVESYGNSWDGAPPNARLLRRDLGAGDNSDLGQFDRAMSFSVFEHVHHPYTMLKAVFDLLKPGGQFYLMVNLYRGPQASHRYREVKFPWPHILFQDDVFEDFYRSIGKPPLRAAWVNQLSVSDYFTYFKLIGFEAGTPSYSTEPIDEPFYKRFEDILGRFPRWDLEKNFLKLTLTKPLS